MRVKIVLENADGTLKVLEDMGHEVPRVALLSNADVIEVGSEYYSVSKRILREYSLILTVVESSFRKSKLLKQIGDL